MAISQNEWITVELNGALPKRMDHLKSNGSQIEWHTFKLNGKLPKNLKLSGSQMHGPPRNEFWTTLKEPGSPGIDEHLIQSFAEEITSSWRTSCYFRVASTT